VHFYCALILFEHITKEQGYRYEAAIQNNYALIAFKVVSLFTSPPIAE
jgi:hypothetical protein